MSIFDPDTFMTASVEGSNDTFAIPLPSGEYLAQVEDLKFREVTGKDGSPRYLADVSYDVLDDKAKQILARDKIVVRQALWLDLTSQGQIDTGKGKNIGLGKLRAAAGLNEPGKPFSLSNLKGAVVKISTGLRPDKNDPSIQYAEVKSVGQAS